MLISVPVDRERLIHTDGVFKDHAYYIHDVSTIKSLNYFTDEDWYGVTFLNDSQTSCDTEELLKAGAIKEGDPGTKSYKKGQMSPEERYRRQEAEYKNNTLSHRLPPSHVLPPSQTDAVIISHGKKLRFTCNCGCIFDISAKYCLHTPSGYRKAKCPECTEICVIGPD